MHLTGATVGALLTADLAASVNLISTRRQARRFALVIVAIAAVVSLAVFSAVRGRLDRYDAPLGVASAVGVSGVMVGTVLMSIVGEFRSATGGMTSRWLSRQPVSTVWSYLVPRSTTWLANVVVTVVTVPALSWTIAESTGSSLGLSMALALLAVGFGSTLGLLVATTPGQLRVSSRSGAALSMLFWIVFAAASGTAMSGIFDRGIDESWTWWYELLGWPALVRLTVDESVGNFVSPISFLVVMACSFAWRVRSPGTGERDHAVHAWHEWQFASFPIVKLETVRALRNPKLRNHGLAMAVGTLALVGADRMVHLDPSAGYSYAALFSLMTGSLLIAKRGTAGRNPLATRLLFRPTRYFVEMKLSDVALVLVLATLAALALGLAPFESGTFVFLARSTALSFGLATVIGSSYLVAARDSTGDLIAVGALMFGFMTAGRVSEVHHLAVGAVSVVVGIAAFGFIESIRYRAEWR